MNWRLVKNVLYVQIGTHSTQLIYNALLVGRTGQMQSRLLLHVLYLNIALVLDKQYGDLGVVSPQSQMQRRAPVLIEQIQINTSLK